MSRDTVKTRTYTIILILIVAAIVSYSFAGNDRPAIYKAHYEQRLAGYRSQLTLLQDAIVKTDLGNAAASNKLRAIIGDARISLKKVDFWLRYLEPVMYKKLNGPLPVEWETEVFEKFEKPYKREGAGLSLALQYLDNPKPDKDTLLALIKASISATDAYAADSITKELDTYHHFFLCNRLFLLNLAAIYTTGFESPDTASIIPELRAMMAAVGETYTIYNERFPATAMPEQYLRLYKRACAFVDNQPGHYSDFDHYTFLRDYVNPLFAINQQLILEYKVVSHSLVDYSLNKGATSIFSKTLYNGQNSKGIFLRVDDTAVLAEIDRIGKLLFYDPILSGNNQRSCASCHKPAQFFTDTAAATAFQYNHQDFLARNSPSLVNASYNHLVMMDGKHYTLQNQTKAVVTNVQEMGSDEREVLEKIMSCKEYRQAFNALLKYTPQEPEVTFEHIASAITYYYGKFSKSTSPFDIAMNRGADLDADARKGFNLFMGKAQCGTCHFVPQFNGVKPPYVSSEFEVLGVPRDINYTALSTDNGRYEINAVEEMRNAFRTGTVRNAARTAPYMHNGVFTTLRQVIDFYDAGGGAGHGLKVTNQTLAADSLHLTAQEKNNLIRFVESLTEDVKFEKTPERLPHSRIDALNERKVGGVY